MVRRHNFEIKSKTHLAGDLAQRVLATDNGAYSALLRLLGKPGADLQCKVYNNSCLTAECEECFKNIL